MTDWDELVSANAKDVFSIAVRILGSEHDAEDVTQDVFCEALRLAESKNIHDWPGMLRRLAALRSVDRLRRRRETTGIVIDPAVQTDPVSDITTTELAQQLRDSISQLPEQQAAVFSLTYFQSYSREEIAKCLEISAEAVSTALYKARTRLKSILLETHQGINHG